MSDVSFRHAPWLRPSFAFRLIHSSKNTGTLSQKLGFHGTSFENIWSILHTGLLNLSQTALERTGAAFGSGIYLSTDLAVAFSFSKSCKGWDNSAIGRQLRAVLVCSVIHHGDDDDAPQLPSATSSSSPDKYLIVQRSDAVQIEYILLYVDVDALEVQGKEEELNVDNKKKTKRKGAGVVVVWSLLFLLLASLVVMEHMLVIKRMFRSKYPFFL